MMRIPLFFIFITFFLYFPYFVYRQFPFSGNFLLAWFEPWKTQYTVNNVPTIVHKPVGDDVFRVYLPWKNLSVDLLKEQTFPLWNPYNGSGTPLLATTSINVFNPLSFLASTLHPLHALTWNRIVQIFFLIFCLYGYSRKIGLSLHASVFSSLTFLFSGYTTSKVIFQQVIIGYAILFALLWVLEVLSTNPTSQARWLIPVFLAWLIDTTHPHFALLVIGFFIVYGISIFFNSFSLHSERIRLMSRFVLLIVLGLGLSAVLIIPTAELAGLSNMSTQASGLLVQSYLLPVKHLVSVIIPNYFGNAGTYNFWGKGEYSETAGSIGTIPILMAIITLSGIRKDGNWRLRFFWIFLIVTLLLAYDTPFSRWFYTIPIPLLATSPPSRFLGLTTVTIALISGLGFERFIAITSLGEFFRKSRMFFIVYLGVVCITLYVWMMRYPCPVVQIPLCRIISVRNTVLETAVLGVFLVLTIVKIRMKWSLIRGAVLGFLISIGLYNSWKYIPFSGEHTYYPRTSLITYLQRISSTSRIMGLGSAAIPTNFATQFRVFDPNVYSPLYVKRYGVLLQYAQTGIPSHNIPRSDALINNDLGVDEPGEFRRDRLMDILGVRYVVYKNDELKSRDSGDEKVLWSDEAWTVTERQSSLPRAYIVHEAEVFTEDAEILSRLYDPSFDPQETVILESLPNGLNESSGGRISTASIIRYSANTIEIRTLLDRSGILVLSDTFYPGWKASVDGQPVEVMRAQFTLRSVVVPAGEHTVRFMYQPDSFRLGVVISTGSLLILVFLVLRSSRLYLLRAIHKRTR